MYNLDTCSIPCSYCEVNLGDIKQHLICKLKSDSLEILSVLFSRTDNIKGVLIKENAEPPAIIDILIMGN